MQNIRETKQNNIKTLRVLAGSLPKRANSLVLEWAAEHRDELVKNWERASVPEHLNKIEPLE